MTSLHDHTALELHQMLQRGDVSPVELAEHYLARIERLNPEVGAFATVTPEAALVVRCSWFLARLRGWSEAPETSEVPDSLLSGRPALRRVAIGLAHPGLLLATGLASALLAMLAAEVELSFFT